MNWKLTFYPTSCVPEPRRLSEIVIAGDSPEIALRDFATKRNFDLRIDSLDSVGTDDRPEYVLRGFMGCPHQKPEIVYEDVTLAKIPNEGPLTKVTLSMPKEALERMQADPEKFIAAMRAAGISVKEFCAHKEPAT